MEANLNLRLWQNHNDHFLPDMQFERQLHMVPQQTEYFSVNISKRKYERRLLYICTYTHFK